LKIAVERIDTDLAGVFEIRPKIHRDARGYFLEAYHSGRLADLGLKDIFVQDNESCSKKGTIRAFHYQLKRPQARLCRIIQGEAFDVVVDIRVGSPTFGKSISLILSAEKQNQIYMPPGFAHGLQALEDNTRCIYKCSDFYDASDGYGIVWNDADLRAQWPISPPIVSEKDAAYPRLRDIAQGALPIYRE
jgi:dTDP-4-dehydrorhamnose 3,5-epimerase